MALARGILALMFCALACAAGRSGGANDAQLIATVMQDRYGAGYLAAQQCWLYVHREYGRYCVKTLKSEWISSKGAAGSTCSHRA